MLPTTSRGRAPSSSTSRANSSTFPHYLRRIIKWQQMDIEYTFWQMLNLCTSPKVVYQHTKYHKQTKNQWARDDPAFIVICSLLLVVAALAYCAAYDHSAGHAVFVELVWLHFVGKNHCPHESNMMLILLYAFDVHCNSFFPMFVMLYVIHYFLSPLLVAHGFMPALLSNLLFMVAASYYHYLNFLGYDGHLPILDLSLRRTVLTWSEWSPRWKPPCCSARVLCALLPFLERTTFFLYPIGVVFVLSPICKLLNTISDFTFVSGCFVYQPLSSFNFAVVLSGFNPSRYFMNVYFSQRVY
ncbi:hypothetical protein SADUNF_Sadunf09G0077500 [Salix dunnii]|uniref:UNC-50 family protein n=1 Tax=Salix dunnii TaxID=1413687 RepID=A0A835MWB5_9ROSI|nr:hypothetical protein SADUNF_Sadunf09G0077500 [Salix dunnii]